MFILLRHYFYFVAVLWLSYVCFKFLLSLFIYNRLLVLLYIVWVPIGIFGMRFASSVKVLFFAVLDSPDGP